MKMVRVLITVDTEVWPLDKEALWSRQWKMDTQAIRASIDAYILGRTSDGDFGVPYILSRLAHYDCRAVFFVEPLFSRELGAGYLRETVNLIRSSEQDVELHLHAEWNEKGREPVVPANRGRNMRDYTLGEQIRLIGEGASLLKSAGVEDLAAFRAGGYAANSDTLSALAESQIPIDSSLNGSIGSSGDTELRALARTHSLFQRQGAVEVPVTVYRDRSSNWRHAQLGACSAMELKHLLDQAFTQQCKYFVIVLHGSELLNRDKTRADPVMLRRLDALLSFLQRSGDRFKTIGFAEIARDVHSETAATHAHDLRTPVWMTTMRMLEQVRRTGR